MNETWWLRRRRRRRRRHCRCRRRRRRFNLPRKTLGYNKVDAANHDDQHAVSLSPQSLVP